MPQLPGVDPRRQVVCHVDVDCFYAACERLREPKLRDEPVVVGMGYEPGADHGAVATASYEAREHGVESAMAISEALKRLPQRTDSESGEAGTGYYRPVDMAYYESVSEDVQAVLDDTAETVRNVSIDEAYLDLGDLAWDDAEAFGRQLKADIEAAAGVVASVGIAPTMATAKLASDAEKPDGLVIVDPDSVATFLKPIPVAELHGVGPVTAAELRERGYETAGDVAAADETALVDAFGERGRDIYRQARGEDDRVVEPKGRPKSLSSESAFPKPTDDGDRKRRKLTALAADVTERATAKDALYRTVGIKVVEPPFDVHTRERSLSGPVDDPKLVEEIAVDLLAEFDDPAVRKLGVRVSNLSFDDREQATLGQWADGTADQEPVRLSHVRRSGETDTQLELSQFE
ncbi:DNA-directed DNA polymerase Y [Natronomonas pharaonis DSM 2160]|uniref:DNA polymerase IV n=1 Tax=Natronomonas pharaonis (strain ATCC 35678 / DSM 2160 / CIP 103997 / JCM 8858 / NBRC 14720 / NCIMB 2260 / Gabara) TaxID=348780 RepID=A0A1U7EWR9_NATPD|nr:DNA polymerase IV [Natronomonas pharaonis]CAI49550.1 DNA-directed DNA polymerase Y [Natronomonas pharaonis DSM 2160]